MIRLTRLNGGVLHLNADLIATVENHHDTVLTLVDGKTYVLLDSVDEVVDAVREYRASILVAADRLGAQARRDGSARDTAARESAGRGTDEGGRVLVLRPAESMNEGR